MTLPLLMGECPSVAGDRYSGFPLSGRVGRTLCQLAGIEPEAEGSTYGRWYWALRGRFDCVNLFERHQPRWSVPAARNQAAAHRAEWDKEGVGRVVVLLGVRTGRAFDLEPRWGEWEPVFCVGASRRMLEHQFVVVPHPSGLNRVLNSEVERARAGRVLREAIARAAEAVAA